VAVQVVDFVEVAVAAVVAAAAVAEVGRFEGRPTVDGVAAYHGAIASLEIAFRAA
jgi:hypothetical protein